MLIPFCCSTLKVSLITRWPLMKTPKVPESIICGPACEFFCFWSFLLPAHRGKDEASAKAKIQRVEDDNVVTPLLLVLNEPQFLSGRETRRSRRRSRPRCAARLRFSRMRANRLYAEIHRVHEIDPCFAAGGAARPSALRADSNVSIAFPLPHPEIRWGCRRLSTGLNSAFERTRRPQEQSLWLPRHAVRRAIPAKRRARPREMRVPRNCGRSRSRCAPRVLRCGRPNLQTASSSAARGRGRQWSCRLP